MSRAVVYQNIFTRIQVRPPEAYPGVELERGDAAREKRQGDRGMVGRGHRHHHAIERLVSERVGRHQGARAHRACHLLRPRRLAIHHCAQLDVRHRREESCVVAAERPDADHGNLQLRVVHG